MTLDQLMAFTVNGDHERQEQVFERLSQSYAKEPHVIRRMLTEGAVRASDPRSPFVGLDAYTEDGGVILRDLFQGELGRASRWERVCQHVYVWEGDELIKTNKENQ